MPIDRNNPNWKKAAYATIPGGWGPDCPKNRFRELHRGYVATGMAADDAYEKAYHEIMADLEIDAIDTSNTSDNAMQRLHRAAAGKTAGEKEYVAWVARNVGRADADIDLDGVPCDEAVAMLRWARDNQGDFWKNVWSKVLVKEDLVKGAEAVDDMADLAECAAALDAAEKKK